MNKNLFKKVTSWNKSPAGGDADGFIEWIDVVALIDLGLSLGFSSNGNWIVVGKEFVYEICSGRSYMPLYPILEGNLLDVGVFVKNGLESVQLPVDIVETFPFQEVAISGMNSGSEYWCNLSLKYAQQLQPNVVLVDALDVCSKHAPTQKLRHQARKMKFLVSRSLSL